MSQPKAKIIRAIPVTQMLIKCQMPIRYKSGTTILKDRLTHDQSHGMQSEKYQMFLNP